MDFDDLDDAIDERIAEGGDMTGAMAQLAASQNISDKRFVPKDFLPEVAGSNPRFPDFASLSKGQKGKLKDPAPKRSLIRCFVFYGLGENAGLCAGLLSVAPESVDVIVYEWPGRGARKAEKAARTLDALVDDAYESLMVPLESHQSGEELEGAPFVLMSTSAGVVVMTAVADRLQKQARLAPAAVIALDSPPPDVPFLTTEGQSMLASQGEDLFGTLVSADSLSALRNQGPSVVCRDLGILGHGLQSGAHSFGCEVLVFKAQKGGGPASDPIPDWLEDRNASQFQETTIICGSGGQKLCIPTKKSTTAGQVKEALMKTYKLDSEPDIKNQAGKSLGDREPIPQQCVLDLADTRAQPHKWPHPLCILGAGYNGIKTAMCYKKAGQDNFIMFDRRNRAGGKCWIDNANKGSKIQTEFGSFHVWWGPEYAADTEKCGWAGLCGGKELSTKNGYSGDQGFKWDTWMCKVDVLAQFQFAVKQYGIEDHCQFESNVSAMEIVGGATNPDRYYNLTVESLKGKPKKQIKVSAMFNYPGSLVEIRRVNYPGEDTFPGQIGYGMCDEFTYDDRLVGKRSAILGNGAFAIENVRTMCEHGASKVYVVTRRKNLCSPRFASWFCHQGPDPTPGWMVLKMFEPMYELAGMGDPWKYHAVHADSTKTNVQIIQSSRFGIGDVTFIMHIYGKLEYIEDTLARVEGSTLHLTKGGKIEDVSAICKSLGQLGDWAFDKLHGLKEMVGNWCDGDWRRPVSLDATGMNAANFTTFSIGSGAYGGSHEQKYMFDFPHEYDKMERLGVLDQLPRNSAHPEVEKPAYVTDVVHAMASGFITGALIPEAGWMSAEHNRFKYQMYHDYHPFEQFHKECMKDWDYYQDMFKKQGCTHEYVPYPYTRENMTPFFEKYNETLGQNISIDGPDEAMKEVICNNASRMQSAVRSERIAPRLMCVALHSGGDEAVNVIDARRARVERAKLTTGGGVAPSFEGWKDWSSRPVTIRVIDSDYASLAVNAQNEIFDFVKKFKAPEPSG